MTTAKIIAFDHHPIEPVTAPRDRPQGDMRMVKLPALEVPECVRDQLFAVAVRFGVPIEDIAAEKLIEAVLRGNC